MGKKRSEKQPAASGSTRATRNRTRQQQDEEPAQSNIEPLLLLKESPLSRSRSELRRNPDMSSREMDPSLEETLLAFLDTHGVRDVEDIEEDKLKFLDVTYARCGVRPDASLPTRKMFEAIFRNALESQSVELTMASFQLLKDLEKVQRHPRVSIVAEEGDENADQLTDKLYVDLKVWSPIEQMIEDIESTDKMLQEASPASLDLFTLIQTILCKGSDWEGAKMVGHLLLFQHFVNLIEKDLYCRLQVYKASKDASDVQESYLYRLVCVSIVNKSSTLIRASTDDEKALRPDIRKNFFSDLVFLLDRGFQQIQMDDEGAKDVDYGLTGGRDGLFPSTYDVSHLAYRLLFMAMEIDHMTKKGNPGNSRSLRRGSFPDDLLSIFNDPRDLETYLAALDSPGTKLRFIVDYSVATAPQDIVGKDLKDNIGIDTFGKFLACFGEEKIKKFVHKFGEDVLPLLLAHGFQASLILNLEGAGERNDGQFRAKLIKESELLVDTLVNLEELEGQLLPVARNALYMAESISKLSILIDAQRVEAD